MTLVRTATPDDVAAVREVARSAGERFRVLDGPELTPGLRRVMAQEADLGLVPELRVAMARPRARGGNVDPLP